MRPLYTAQQSRDVDRELIERMPIDGYELMRRAGKACYRRLKERWPQARRVRVYTGFGNNGGDACVVARLLAHDGVDVRVATLGDPEKLRGDAAQALAEYMTGRLAYAGRAAHRPGELTFYDSPDDPLDDVDVVVDGMFGSGLSRPLSPALSELIEKINRSSAGRLAVDIPSGVNADTGCAMPVAVKADLTVSFITRKQGLYTGDGKDFCGELVFDDLQLSALQERDFSKHAPSAWLAGYADCRRLFAPRKANTHKGMFGHLAVVGGNYGMAGAVCLAGLAALRVGAGLVTVATRPEHAREIGAEHSVLMTRGISDGDDLNALLERVDAVVFGPGLGGDDWSRALFDRLVQCDLPVVADADALRLLAQRGGRFPHWVLTPHPGEAARLLDIGTQRVQADRFGALAALRSCYAAVPVLKGAGTLIAADEKIFVCEGGNPGMSSAGTGDVLSGVVGGLIVQGMETTDAAVAGVCLHAEAGDRSAGSSPRGLIASDLLAQLRRCVNPAGFSQPTGENERGGAGEAPGDHGD